MVSRGRRRGTTRFSVEPEQAAKDVFLAGDFTDWQPRRMRRQRSGAFVLNLPLPAGEHQYKFLVDGQWLADPDNSACALNPYGTVNSVVTVAPPRPRRSARGGQAVSRTPEPVAAG